MINENKSILGKRSLNENKESESSSKKLNKKKNLNKVEISVQEQVVPSDISSPIKKRARKTSKNNNNNNKLLNNNKSHNNDLQGEEDDSYHTTSSTGKNIATGTNGSSIESSSNIKTNDNISPIQQIHSPPSSSESSNSSSFSHNNNNNNNDNNNNNNEHYLYSNNNLEQISSTNSYKINSNDPYASHEPYSPSSSSSILFSVVENDFDDIQINNNNNNNNHLNNNENENNDEDEEYVSNNEHEQYQQERCSFESLVNSLRDKRFGIPIQDHRFHFRSFAKCFKGSDFVTWILSNGIQNSRKDAVDLGNKMMRFGLFHHVTYSESFEDNDNALYRFINDDKDNILNLRKLWVKNNTREDSSSPLSSPLSSSLINESQYHYKHHNYQNQQQQQHYSGTQMCEIATRLLHRLLSIVSQSIASDGSIDTYHVANDKQFVEWEESTAELQIVELDQMKPGERMSFFINVYNMLCIHCQVVMGFPVSKFKRWNFFQSTCYQIGKETYSLDDIEHGLLRGNKSKPWSLFRQFSQNDSRMKYVFPRGEGRIHFAISCGTPSDPPIRVYPSDVVGEELLDAARSYCDSNIHFNETTGEIILPRIFSWYSSDFGSTTKDILSYVAKFMNQEQSSKLLNVLRSERQSIQYQRYQWRPYFKCIFPDGETCGL